MLHDTKGRQIVSTDEAAKMCGVDPSYIRKLAKAGELKRVVESPRRVFYYLTQVEKITKEKASSRKRRGGRPRKGPAAA